MLHAVSREERHPPARDLAHRDRGRGRAVGGLDDDALDILEERIEARAAEDADLGSRRQADFPLAASPDFFSAEPDVDFFESPPEPPSEAAFSGGRFEDRLSVR